MRFLIWGGWLWACIASAQTLCYLTPVDGYWQVVTRNLDGTGRKILTHSLFDKKDPVFHPDGKRIFFSGVNQGVFSVNLKSGKEKKIPTTISGIRGLKFSKDGKQTLFYRARVDANDQSEIWRGDSVLQNNARIIYRPGLQRYPDGNKDFSTILYLSGRAVTGHDIWIYRPQEDKHIRVTKDMLPEGAPSISPSGQWAVFPSAPEGVYNIFLVDIGKATSQLLFPNEHALLDLDWINDQEIVCVIMKKSGEPQLAKANIQEKNLVELPWKEEHGVRSPSIYKP